MVLAAADSFHFHPPRSRHHALPCVPTHSPPVRPVANTGTRTAAVAVPARRGGGPQREYVTDRSPSPRLVVGHGGAMAESPRPTRPKQSRRTHTATPAYSDSTPFPVRFALLRIGFTSTGTVPVPTGLP